MKYFLFESTRNLMRGKGAFAIMRNKALVLHDIVVSHQVGMQRCNNFSFGEEG